MKHGLHLSPEFAAWREIRYRCNTKTAKAYPNYGGRGIKVCERWMESFENFIKDMGFRPSENHSLDRINNNGNYEPSNCRWATSKEQQNNTRKTIFCEFNGARKPLSEWAAELGIDRNTISEGIRTCGKDISYYINKHNLSL